jgi:hypothetical protein
VRGLSSVIWGLKCVKIVQSLKMTLKISKLFVDKKLFWEFFQIFGAIFGACKFFRGCSTPQKPPLINTIDIPGM